MDQGGLVRIKLIACECGAVADWILDQKTPILADKAGNVFIQLKTGVRWQIRFCPFCGGQRSRNIDYICTCDALMRFSALHGSNVHFDSSLNEHVLVFGDGGKIFFYFCPECGGKLPPSRRSELFCEPSFEEMAKMRNKLQSVQNLQEVKHLLGEPDIVRELPLELDPSFGKPSKTAWFYERHTKTFSVLIQTMTDGSIRISFPRKEQHV